jgi:transposase
VAKADYYDPVANRDYAALASHYGFAILPARPVSPRDKASAENAVKFCQTWVVAYLRAERFFSLGELNRAVRGRVDEMNAQPFKGLDWSRRDVFDAEEAPALGPLPGGDYEPAEWKTAKAALDYCVKWKAEHFTQNAELGEMESRVLFPQAGWPTTTRQLRI